jgi:predicted dienelactone hydrolase
MSPHPRFPIQQKPSHLSLLVCLMLFAYALVASPVGLAQAAKRTATATESESTIALVEQRGELIVGNRRQPYVLIAPTSGESLPIVLFSHGAYSTKDLYLDILRPWAAAGFVVVAPTHADSVSLGTSRGAMNPNFFAWRIADMQAIIQQLPTLLSGAGVVARADTTRIAATGHSFGGWIAQTMAGAGASDPAGGDVSVTEPRIKMAIIHSGAGVMPGVLSAENFKAMTVPVLVTVGTADLAQAPGMSGYEWRRQPYDLLGSPERWLLIQEEADHYLGGRVGRDDLPRSEYAEDYLNDFLWLSTLTLRAWLAEDPVAQASLNAAKQSIRPSPLRRATIEHSETTAQTVNDSKP